MAKKPGLCVSVWASELFLYQLKHNKTHKSLETKIEFTKSNNNKLWRRYDASSFESNLDLRHTIHYKFPTTELIFFPKYKLMFRVV